MNMTSDNTNLPAPETGKQPEPIWIAMKNILSTSRGVQLLSAVLALQLLFAGGLYWYSNRSADFNATESLVSIDVDAIDELAISTLDERISLIRSGEGWSLNEETGLPAESVKVDQLLATLDGLAPGLPVAMTTTAQSQQEVAEDNFQRRLILKSAGEVSAELFVGTSPGYRKAHVRKADDTAIYAASVNVFDIPADVDSWLDKTVLYFSNITGIKGDDFAISKVDDQWQIDEPASSQADNVVAQAAVSELLDALQGLRVQGLAVDADTDANVDALDQPLDEEAADDIRDVEATEATETSLVELQVQSDSGSWISLNLIKHGEQISASRSDFEKSFRVSESVFSQLEKVNAAWLLMDKAESAGQEGAAQETPEHSTAESVE